MKRAVILIIFGISLMSYAGVVNTKHNLSKSGPGTVKSSQEDRVCIFCHTPHNSLSYAPLWNRELSTAIYTTYSSNTMNATPWQPSGNSKLCLSCHDGTIAINAIYNGGTIADMSSPISGSARIGTDLRDDHPISFTFDASLASADGQLKSPNALPSFIKLQAGRIECTTCHDPHTEAVYFLRNADKLALCTSCHDKKTGTLTFNFSVHNSVISNSPVSSDYSCGNCHKAHNAKDMTNSASTTQLLRGVEENLCFVCHGNLGNLNGAPVPNGTGINIQARTDTTPGTYFASANTPGCGKSATGQCHKGKWSGTITSNYRFYNKSHDVINSAQTGNSTHMECINCHGPHGVQDDNLVTTTIESLLNPDTIQLFTPVDNIPYAGGSNYWKKFYRMNEFCLKCHDGSYPSNPGGRSDLTISTANNRATINVATSYANEKHGRKSIPCMACHDIHSGNHLAIDREINWNIDGGAPFSTKDASKTLVTTINMTSIDFRDFCYGTCHRSKSFSGHDSPHVAAVNNGTSSCISCHFHNGGIL